MFEKDVQQFLLPFVQVWHRDLTFFFFLCCSFKDLCGGKLKDKLQDTFSSRMVSPAISPGQTLRGSVWTLVDWDVGLATIFLPSLIPIRGHRPWECRGKITWCLLEWGQTCSTWLWRKWKRSQWNSSRAVTRTQSWRLILKMRAAVRLTQIFRNCLMSWQRRCHLWMT